MNYQLSRKYYLGTQAYRYMGETGGLLCFRNLETGIKSCFIQSLSVPNFTESPSA